MGLVLVLSVLFAILVGVGGYINYMSEYENGSESTDAIQHLSAGLSYRTGMLNSLNGEWAAAGISDSGPS